MTTIEEFIEQNWMHFRDCWVAMDKDGKWFLHQRKPSLEKVSFFSAPSVPLFEISPAEDWTKSCQKIKKPVNPNDWIGKLCWFDNNRGCEPVVGILREVVDGFFVYRDDVDTIWERCRPLTEKEMKNLISKE